jgi:hypothetical protein
MGTLTFLSSFILNKACPSGYAFLLYIFRDTLYKLVS